MVVPEDVINQGIGVQLGSAQMADLLSRMQLQAEPVQGQQAVRVRVPPTRSDVLHACDVMEVCLADVFAQRSEVCCAQVAWWAAFNSIAKGNSALASCIMLCACGHLEG